jgi:FMN phosphatase YigB (HAD superfamily)
MSDIKAVLFDWVGTLARPDPDRHEGLRQVALQLGYDLPLDVLSRSVYKADYEVSIGSPGVWKDGEEINPFLECWKVCLAATDIEIPDDMLIEITRRGKEWVKGANWVLYDDVMATVKSLKEKRMLLGVVSTLRFDKAELSPYLDVTVTP